MCVLNTWDIIYIFAPSSLYCDDLCLLIFGLAIISVNFFSVEKETLAEGPGWTFFLITVVLLNFLFLVYFAIYSYIPFF